MTNFKEIQISEIFDLYSGDKLRKINDLKGDYPVISAQSTNDGVIGYTNNPYFLDCNNGNLYITFGDHTKYIKIRNIPFSTTDAVKTLKVKSKYENKVNLNYIIKSWQILMPNLGYTRYWKHVKDIFIKLPINENGEFDLEKQKEIALKYEKLEKLKGRIRIMKEDLENQKVSINSKNIESIKLIDLVEIQRGKSKYTQTYAQNNQGNYNLYSAKTTENGLMGKVDFYDFDTECLTYTTNGVKAGTLFYREKHKFSLNGDSAIILFKNTEKLDYKFFYYSLYFKFKQYGFSWENKATPAKIYEIEIDIPIKKSGEFDLEKQKEIALKYEKIEKIQKNLIEELEYLEKVKVEI